jgi:hypothetical protein
MMNPVVPAIIRGQVVVEDLVDFEGRGGSLTFATPDPSLHVKRLPLASGSELADLHTLSFDDILDYLEELGERLDPARNEHLRWARELTYATSQATKPLVDNAFRSMRYAFDRELIREMADKTIGLGYLNGWVRTRHSDGIVEDVRAFGARGLHIIPGNGPTAIIGTLIKGAFTRSDLIVKTPSNNPFAAVAVGQTMCEMAPDHPITKHLAIAYWRGGDEAVERPLIQPHNIDKIVAWGGFASVKHVTRYIQPGLELISLDPKFSTSVIDLAALTTDEQIREAALRLAVDVGAGNQEPCSAARVAYVLVGPQENTDLANRFGEYVYQELVGLPSALSTKPKTYDAELRSNVGTVRLQDDFYNVIGGTEDEGCVIVSQLSDPVDFAPLLADRTANIVPVESLADVIPRFDAYTQTVGVYPESVRDGLRDIAPFSGVQRFATLGYSNNHSWRGPHDGIELERRMCKWVVSQSVDPIPVSFAGERASAPPDDAVLPRTLEAVRTASA